MPFKTPYGNHYHIKEGCHTAFIPCTASEKGLAPCSDCCGGSGGIGGGSGIGIGGGIGSGYVATDDFGPYVGNEDVGSYASGYENAEQGYALGMFRTADGIVRDSKGHAMNPDDILAKSEEYEKLKSKINELESREQYELQQQIEATAASLFDAYIDARSGFLAVLGKEHTIRECIPPKIPDKLRKEPSRAVTRRSAEMAERVTDLGRRTLNAPDDIATEEIPSRLESIADICQQFWDAHPIRSPHAKPMNTTTEATDETDKVDDKTSNESHPARPTRDTNGMSKELNDNLKRHNLQISADRTVTDTQTGEQLSANTLAERLSKLPDDATDEEKTALALTMAIAEPSPYAFPADYQETEQQIRSLRKRREEEHATAEEMLKKDDLSRDSRTHYRITLRATEAALEEFDTGMETIRAFHDESPYDVKDGKLVDKKTGEPVSLSQEELDKEKKRVDERLKHAGLWLGREYTNKNHYAFVREDGNRKDYRSVEARLAYQQILVSRVQQISLYARALNAQ